MKPITSYVGLDVHKSTISVAVAVAEDGRRGEVRHYGVIENRADIAIKLAARLGRRGERLCFCYEAGPCGYGLHRLLSGLGHNCTVVAPSLIPKKPGDRVKTNRRDAAMLAKLHRAGELTAVWVPDAAHEAMRGVAFINAVTIVAEIGDFARFSNPRQLMAYVGLVPSEHSSGDSVRRGGITKAGNGQARRALIEGAMQARVSRKLHDRIEDLPQRLRDTAWKAQVRLCGRYRRLVAKGKPRVVVTTTIAREMIGFIWAIARQVKLQTP
jgi:transposase